jgi:MFS family permease
MHRLSPNIAALGYVSMLTAISSAMIYSVLPIFLVKAMNVSVASVGLMEGMAEAANSLVKILSGATSDRIGRRKPLVACGYVLSAAVKTVFPVAESAAVIVSARVIDRLGKGIRDAPRDAFLADLSTPDVRGAAFGLRLAVAISGFVVGPLLAVGLMKLSSDDFRLVFWAALIPAYFAIGVLIVAVKELPAEFHRGPWRLPIRRADITGLPAAFWWVILIASLLSLARFSQAFLVLVAIGAGIDSAFAPLILVVMHILFSAAAYPFGLLANHIDRRLQLGLGAVILIGADLVLGTASSVWATVLGAGLWGLQLGVTQGLLGVTVADSAPDRLRGTAFGIYDLAVGITAFVASAGAGALWAVSGPILAFGVSACIAATATLVLLIQPSIETAASG